MSEPNEAQQRGDWVNASENRKSLDSLVVPDAVSVEVPMAPMMDLAPAAEPTSSGPRAGTPPTDFDG
jgi:hypothetical protein